MKTIKTNTKSKFKAGMYLLETLTAGMYNDPFSILREYIQNAVDSIDFASNNNFNTKMKVEVEINPFEKVIEIIDNGFGIPSKEAEYILSSVGGSKKESNAYRGFRGIGRLGGLAFCEKTTFTTKTIGENIESTHSWNSDELQLLLGDRRNHKNMSLKNIYDLTSNFSYKKVQKINTSYFKVKLEGVKCFRNQLFDIKKVHDYLCQNIPVPFHPDFKFGHQIDEQLSKNVINYKTYNIYLNGEKLYKPYSHTIKTVKKGFDVLDSISYIPLLMEDDILAYGWYGQRKELLGSLQNKNVSGMRVKIGNLSIGGPHLLDSCFRENRFNGYMIGEIHIIAPNLIPNSRRDDFIDNNVKLALYNEIEKTLGLPISKEIRQQSKIMAEKKSDVILPPLLANEIVNGHKILNKGKVDSILNDLNIITKRYPNLPELLKDLFGCIEKNN